MDTDSQDRLTVDNGPSFIETRSRPRSSPPHGAAFPRFASVYAATARAADCSPAATELRRCGHRTAPEADEAWAASQASRSCSPPFTPVRRDSRTNYRGDRIRRTNAATVAQLGRSHISPQEANDSGKLTFEGDVAAAERCAAMFATVGLQTHGQG